MHIPEKVYCRNGPLYTLDNGYIDLNNPDILNHVEIEVPNFYATVRTDTEQVLGIVGNDYNVKQNMEAFKAFDVIVGGDGTMYETAGAPGKGERFFITAKLPSYLRVGKDDIIENYIFTTSSHDGTASITAASTIRIVLSKHIKCRPHWNCK